MTTLAAVLVGEPFGLPLDRVGKLTLWQIDHVYFHTRDERGRLVPHGATRPETPEEQFFAVWRLRGMKDHDIRRRWQQCLARADPTHSRT